VSDLVPQFRFIHPEIATDSSTVAQQIQPVYVRTTKAELNLPDVHEIVINVPMRPDHEHLYRLVCSEIARDAERLRLNQKAALRKIGRSALRLIQLASNPALLAGVDFQHPELLGAVLSEGDGPKLQLACLRARQLAREGRKCIIWSSFVGNVELVADRLQDLGAEFIHGQVEAGSDDEEDSREWKIKRFHEDPDCFVLVGNPAACGEGISLHTVCHNAIYVDRTYNAAQFLQSKDRIHRFGLKPGELTNIEILVAPNTVDDSVFRRLDAKMRLMGQVLDDQSLRVEPVHIDPDEDVFDSGDFDDLLRHLSDKAQDFI
jgi:SNF2 family DNA or RNA helicase